MAKSIAARAEARFKQLCCLDLAGEAVIPALLQELHILVPYYWARVFLIDEGSGSQTLMTSTPMLTSPPPSIGRNSTGDAAGNWQAPSPISSGLKLESVISKKRSVR